MNKEEKIRRLLAKGVETAIPQESLEKVLSGTKKLRIKFGIDPTAPDLHLGHAVVLRKLREFQDLGHKLVLIIGDFTAQIGDPTGKNKTRPPLTEKEVKENMKNYLHQAAKIIDIKKAEVHYNSKWLKKLQGKKLLEVLSLITIQQMMERDDFSKRQNANEPIRIHELLYPVMQAYDSVAIKADIECGGSDQTFNLLTGRSLMEKFGLLPQGVLTTTLLEGLDGEKKMSKSLGNYVSLNELPKDMFGKIMSLPDGLMKKYFELCTTLSSEEIEDRLKSLSPREAKAELAYQITTLYHGEKKAKEARENFDKVFSKKEISASDAVILPYIEGTITSYAVSSGISQSNGAARRLIEQGGFKVNGETVKDPNFKPQKGDILKIGKHSFFRLK